MDQNVILTLCELGIQSRLLRRILICSDIFLKEYSDSFCNGKCGNTTLVTKIGTYYMPITKCFSVVNSCHTHNNYQIVIKLPI